MIRRFWLAVWMLVVAWPALAETMYIDDTLYVPLRAGEGLQYKIVHKGIKSGTPVEVIRHNPDSGYSEVRTPEGITGYMPTRYLVAKPIAKQRLAALQKQYDALRERSSSAEAREKELNAQIGELTRERDRLAEQVNALQTELNNIKRISANAVQLDQSNRELREENVRLRNEVELLNSDNQRLKDDSAQKMMLYGAGLVLLGVLIAVVVPNLKRQKRSSW
ncbi:MAG: TIGR04211 family SH3 domain-containing protein [Gammaproteobacteria bacterium]|nr:MAG: TIGR04211 family SH3 domain-containing protein [Gammaproteobacteria bacterium]